MRLSVSFLSKVKLHQLTLALQIVSFQHQSTSTTLALDSHFWRRQTRLAPLWTSIRVFCMWFENTKSLLSGIDLSGRFQLATKASKILELRLVILDWIWKRVSARTLSQGLTSFSENAKALSSFPMACQSFFSHSRWSALSYFDREGGRGLILRVRILCSRRKAIPKTWYPLWGSHYNNSNCSS